MQIVVTKESGSKDLTTSSPEAPTFPRAQGRCYSFPTSLSPGCLLHLPGTNITRFTFLCANVSAKHKHGVPVCGGGGGGGGDSGVGERFIKWYAWVVVECGKDEFVYLECDGPAGNRCQMWKMLHLFETFSNGSVSVFNVYLLLNILVIINDDGGH